MDHADAVRKIKFALQKQFHNHKLKVGHAGTFGSPCDRRVADLCWKSNKIGRDSAGGKKAYVAKIIIGATTPSFDKEHEIDEYYRNEHITLEQVNQAIAALEEEHDQVHLKFFRKISRRCPGL